MAIINSLGDTVPTGVLVPAIGQTVLADTMPAPMRYPAGQPLVVPRKNTLKPLGTPDTWHPKTGTTGATLWQPGPLLDTATLPRISTAGREVPCQYPAPTPAGSPRYRDGASHHIRYLGIDEGLPTAYVRQLLEDRQGNLWISSHQGLTRYNGHTFTSFTAEAGLESYQLTALHEDRQGNLWIGDMGESSIIKFNGHSFTYYNKAQGLPGAGIISIYEDNEGRLWFGSSRGGALVYHQGVFKSLLPQDGLPSNNVDDITQDAQGHLWLATKDRLTRYDGTRLHYLPLPQVWDVGWVTVMQPAPDGSLWLGTRRGGLLHYAGDSLTRYSTANGLPHNRIAALEFNEHGQLWVGTYGGGIAHLTPQGFETIGLGEGLANLEVNSLLPGPQGQLWAGTYGGGVNLIVPNSFQTFTTRQGLNENAISYLTEDRQGRLWLGTFGKGFSILGPKSLQHYSPEHGYCLPCGNQINAMAQDPTGPMWMATYRGLIQFDGNTFTHYTAREGLGGNAVHSLVAGKQGHLWLGIQGHGITHFNGYEYTHYTEKGGLNNHTIWATLEDRQGNLWIGSHGGASRFNGSHFMHFSRKEGLSHHVVFCLYEADNGHIWMGTSGGGISIYDGQGFRYLNTSHGLPDDFVYSITKGPQDNLWVSTDKGLARLQPQPDSGYAITRYGKPEGLKSLSFWSQSNLADSKGNLWWGAGQHLTMLSPQAIAALEAEAPEPPQSTVLNLKINNRFTNFHNALPQGTYAYASARPFYNLPEGLVLAHHQNQLELGFAANTPYAPHLVEYSYRLEGAEGEYSPPGPETLATYRNLPPGEYTFAVKARRKGQSWGPTATYMFSILPPWWLTWWAKAAYAVLAFACLGGYVRWRLHSARHQQKRLAQEVQARTQELEKVLAILNQRNQDLTDSIEYAEHIQANILPPPAQLAPAFTDHFVLYRPRDIVSGDFYWHVATRGKQFFAVVDCTGHGVAGAFMSIIGYSLLNQVVLEDKVDDPGTILLRLDAKLRETLHQHSPNGARAQDGMVAALVVVKPETHELLFAGAKQPLYGVQQGQFIQTQGTRRSVGGYVPNPRTLPHFATHTFSYAKAPLTVYLFSDGYADQFNASNTRKFMIKRFRYLLQTLAPLPMAKQYHLLTESLDQWQGSNEQTDDILVAGLKLC